MQGSQLAARPHWPAMTRSLEGRSVGVLGLARSGLAAARLALARGAEVYASDLGESAALRAAADELRSGGAEVDLGRHDVARLARCERVVLSPGIPLDAPVLQDPALREVRVVSEIDFGFAELRGTAVIAITGTNGKTTVTALISHLLRTAGFDAPAGGNIGLALSELALREPAPSWVVVEVSSFQLGLSQDFSPDVGVLTNLAPDHLDWYSTVEAYYADKARLFKNATQRSRWVLNGEDAAVRALVGDAPGERFYFRVASAPAPGERGAYLDGDRLTLRVGEADPERILAAGELRILGAHNVANALAAALVARLAGADPASIADGLRTFRAPAHRLEPVAERNGVLWINDSKATNLASTAVALRSMTRPTVLLLGGRHKGEPYSALIPLMRGTIRRVIAFGEAAERIERDLAGELPVERVAGSFDEVVHRAAEVARPGDAVLLSPACSSYDMFRDFEERGRRFAELAREGAA